MQVDTSVAEADVGRLRDGMDASFTVDAYPSEVFRGKVRQIRNAPQTVQNVVTYDAVVDVANPELRLRPGMTANVTFVYAQKDDVLRVPNAALRFRPPPEMLAAQPGPGNADARPAAQPPDRRTIWVLRGGTPATARIRSGISDGSFTEVVEGELQPGDEVVTDASGGSRGLPAALRRGL
jgi:HlyD family secretion protein